MNFFKKNVIPEESLSQVSLYYLTKDALKVDVGTFAPISFEVAAPFTT